ncbi:hypothetical protein P5673_025248 [Acropora cervicornis]|uniref:Uncharacterized protein n=1 Tax=Acropora cervicornis TaxID=6130 RepID=A0AAD9Q2B9_ACRCE|nr:hypothetical protein P5673_025248 [Acropora cervicornis]
MDCKRKEKHLNTKRNQLAIAWHLNKKNFNLNSNLAVHEASERVPIESTTEKVCGSPSSAANKASSIFPIISNDLHKDQRLPLASLRYNMKTVIVYRRLQRMADPAAQFSSLSSKRENTPCVKRRHRQLRALTSLAYA